MRFRPLQSTKFLTLPRSTKHHQTPLPNTKRQKQRGSGFIRRVMGRGEFFPRLFSRFEIAKFSEEISLGEISHWATRHGSTYNSTKERGKRLSLPVVVSPRHFLQSYPMRLYPQVHLCRFLYNFFTMGFIMPNRFSFMYSNHFCQFSPASHFDTVVRSMPRYSATSNCLRL